MLPVMAGREPPKSFDALPHLKLRTGGLYPSSMMKSETKHVISLSLTKSADGLVDPKLVLSWVLNALGAPGFVIGLLVPVREAGALLPQIALARMIEARRIRKYFWVTGSLVQGAAAVAMGLIVMTLSGAAAGWSTIAALALFATGRSICSASYKDVLARTVEKGRRGRVSGTAATIGSITVFSFAAMLATGVIPREPGVIALALMTAGALWLLASLLFASLDEPPAEADVAGDRSLSALIEPLIDDPELQTYIATRALLISTALAPPFLVLLGSGQGTGFGNLGILLLASSLAAIASSYVWGAFADRSSRLTLAVAGSLATVTFLTAAAIGLGSAGQVGGIWVAGLIFIAQIAYEGARAGRKTHLTDMDTGDRKAVYTALSNTLIGMLLLVGGVLGLLADLVGVPMVLALLAGLSAAAVFTALRLSEVQQET